MAKAKSVTPQSKPAVAAKKNVKAKQPAVKAETKKSVPKKAETSSSEEESSSDEEETPMKANGAATPATAKVSTDRHDLWKPNACVLLGRKPP